jgi:ATP-dependent protease Clp ATPase subunit
MKCSFCGKDHSEAKRFIAASYEIGICDDCVFECMHTLVYFDENPLKVEIVDNKLVEVNDNKS